MLPYSEEENLLLNFLDPLKENDEDELYDMVHGENGIFSDNLNLCDIDETGTVIDYNECLVNDVMWSGNDNIAFTAVGAADQSSLPYSIKMNQQYVLKPQVDLEKEIEGQVLLPEKAYFNCFDSAPESVSTANSNSNNNADSSNMCAVPYTPGYDHNYNKPKSLEVKPEPVDESESESSSGDDEVDIETVSDDGQKMCAIKFQRTLRPIVRPKRYSQRENTPPVKYKNKCDKRVTPRVVSAMLKRTRQYQQNGDTGGRTKRGRRPANSLPCSTASSRSNSDTEEPVVKRSMHNNMERMRRNQQRMALHHLRDVIPELKNNAKASKVKIITIARDYLGSLVRKELSLLEEVRRLRDTHMICMKRVQDLKEDMYEKALKLQ